LAMVSPLRTHISDTANGYISLEVTERLVDIFIEDEIFSPKPTHFNLHPMKRCICHEYPEGSSRSLMSGKALYMNKSG
ncbi:hypothetical protein BDR04DRAFT_1098699, partial [Suillus decipiens]